MFHYLALRLKNNNVRENKQTSQRTIYGMHYREAVGKRKKRETVSLCKMRCLFVPIIRQGATLN